MTHSILGSASTLQGAVDWLFSKSTLFDEYAEHHKIKYYITAAVDVKPDVEGRVRTSDLKPFGLEYGGEFITVEQLRKDRIFPYPLKSDAVWMEGTKSVVVRLDRVDGKQRQANLIARLVYGLFKGMRRIDFTRAKEFYVGDEIRLAFAMENLKVEFHQDVNEFLSELKDQGLDSEAAICFDADPIATPTDVFVKVFVAAKKDPETYGRQLNQVVHWGQENPTYPGVPKATAFAQRLMALYEYK